MTAPRATIDIADRTVRRLGFGAMRIMGADDPVALVRDAVELGAQFIDTADIYGNGASKQFIAEALYPYPDDVVIATKGGFVPGRLKPGVPALDVDCRPERLRQVCDESLRRLRLERIDLYQLHAPDPNVPVAESVGALVELRDDGKLAHIGLSNVGRTHLMRRCARSRAKRASLPRRPRSPGCCTGRRRCCRSRERRRPHISRKTWPPAM